MADFDGSLSQIGVSSSDRMPVMNLRWLGFVGTVLLAGTVLPTRLVAQTERGPYARIAIMRALDGHSVDWEAGYLRHLDWHRQARDTFGWYSYSVWASTERQRWIIYATFGHTAAELSNPVSPAEDSGTTSSTSCHTPSSWGTGSTSSCRRFRAEMVCRLRLFEPSTQPWS